MNETRTFPLEGWPERRGTLYFWILLAVVATLFLLSAYIGTHAKNWMWEIASGACVVLWTMGLMALWIANKTFAYAKLHERRLTLVRPISETRFELDKSSALVFTHNRHWLAALYEGRKCQLLPRYLQDIDELHSIIMESATSLKHDDALEIEMSRFPKKRWYFYGWILGGGYAAAPFLIGSPVDDPNVWILFLIGSSIAVASTACVWWIGKRVRTKLRSAMGDAAATEKLIEELH